jgi:thioredoxin 1
MSKPTFSEMIQGHIPVLVDFSAEWCRPCQMMVPILKELKSKIGDRAKIIQVDVDQSPSAAAAYRVMGVPTLIVFKNGQIKWRTSGVVSCGELERILNQYTVASEN